MNMNEQMKIQLAEYWRSIADANDLKIGTKTYSKAEFMFWQGVAALEIASGNEVPPIISICLMSDRSVSDMILNHKENEEA